MSDQIEGAEPCGIKSSKQEPDYATRLRDEVAMRCFVSYTEGPPETRAANAYINAQAFMAERKRREEAKC